MSPALFEKASSDCVVYLDQIWEKISSSSHKPINDQEYVKSSESVVWSPEIESSAVKHHSLENDSDEAEERKPKY